MAGTFKQIDWVLLVLKDASTQLLRDLGVVKSAQRFVVDAVHCRLSPLQ